MKIRIDRFLCHMGIGSRSEIKKYLKTCRVKLNGKFEKNSNTQVDIEKDEILFDDEIVIYKEFTYLMLNKPKDFISATFDTKLPTVLDLLEFPYSNMELFPVGRLDIDTTGFLILTNDGKFSYNVTNPKKKVNNKYLINYILEILEINDVKYKYHINYKYKSGGDKHEQKKNSYIINGDFNDIVYKFFSSQKKWK